MEHNKLAIVTNWEDRFARFVLNAWKDVSLNFVKILQKTEAKFCRQHLIWNSWLTNKKGQMLGRRTRCAWAELDRGPTRSIDQQMILIRNVRGGKIMYYAIQDALSNF